MAHDRQVWRKILPAGSRPHAGYRQPPVIFPFLFVVSPLLHLYATNFVITQPGEVVVPLAVSLAAATALFLLFRYIFKGSFSAGLLVTCLAFLFYAYGHVSSVLSGIFAILRVGLLHGPQLVVWGILVVAMWHVIAKRGRDYSFLTGTLNVTAALLVAFSLARIGSSLAEETRVRPVQGDSIESQPVRAGEEQLPDIYYIVLDMYARSDILLEYYGYDNSTFINSLTAKGFYVASESRSNYAKTFLSLASSLNMRYLNDPVDETRSEVASERYTYEILLDNVVAQMLRERGYTYIHVASSWGPTAANAYADVVYQYQDPSFFADLVHSTTLLDAFYDPFEPKRNRILYSFDRLAEIPQVEGPTFVLAHVLPPHPPYLFDRDGNPLPRAEAASKSARPENHTDAYVEQLIYVNTLVEELVDDLLAQSDVPPIIIIQADHGTGFSTGPKPDVVPEALITERMPILNAYHLPDGGDALLYPSISPVNSFRVVLDYYFGTELGLIPDKSYFSTAVAPFEFTLVE